MKPLIHARNGEEYSVRSIKYLTRIFVGMRNALIFYALMLLVGIAASKFSSSLYVIGLLFVINFVEQLSWKKTYLLKISIRRDKIILDYLYKDVLKHIEGKPTDFTVSTQNIWYKIRGEVKYLSIGHKSGVVVKQFMLKDIDEKTFSSILQFFAVERARNFSARSFIPDLGIIKGG